MWVSGYISMLNFYLDHSLLTTRSQKSPIMAEAPTVGCLFEPGDGLLHLVRSTAVHLHLWSHMQRQTLKLSIIKFQSWCFAFSDADVRRLWQMNTHSEAHYIKIKGSNFFLLTWASTIIMMPPIWVQWRTRVTCTIWHHALRRNVLLIHL